MASTLIASKGVSYCHANFVPQTHLLSNIQVCHCIHIIVLVAIYRVLCLIASLKTKPYTFQTRHKKKTILLVTSVNKTQMPFNAMCF